MLVFPLVVLLSQAPAPLDPPRLDLAPKGRVDLGSVGPQEVRTVTYQVTNRSAAPLALRILDQSPGVTLAGPALAGPLGPGATAAMTLRVDPAGFVGWQARNVRLGTDDPRQGHYYLPVGMTVRADLTVDRPRASFGGVALHESPEQVFHFKRETGAPTQIRLTAPIPPYLEVELPELKAGPAGGPAEGDLRVILRPGAVPPGMRAGLERLHLATDAPLQPAFQLYVDWRLDLPAIVDPARVVFLSDREARASVRLGSLDGQPLRPVRIWIQGAGFRLEPPPPAAPVLDLVVVREAMDPASALLCVQLPGDAPLLKIPLLYRPAVKGEAPPPAPGTPHPGA